MANNSICTALLSVVLALSICGCKRSDLEQENALFEKVRPSETNIYFSNDLAYNNRFNVYTYRNFYAGGGVAVGDINGDGLSDLYFTSNLGDNKLYLNTGGFTFRDVTEEANVAGTKPWSTGVSMADVNGDGLLDIYVTNSGKFGAKQRERTFY